MAEVREIPFEVPHEDPRKTIRGTIRVADEQLTAEWGEWYPDYGHRVLKVIGDTLGYPVTGGVHDAGHGRCSVKLRRATPEEAATIARIAACEKVDQWPMPPYARREEMRQEFEAADLLLDVQVDSRELQTIFGPQKDDTWWLVDISTSAPAVLSAKWAARAAEDCLRSAREGRWEEAFYAAKLAVGEAPTERRAEMWALYTITMASWIAPEHKVPPAERVEDSVTDACRSYGVGFAAELQRQIDRLSGLIGLASTVNVKESIRTYLARHPKDRDSRLVKIVEEK